MTTLAGGGTPHTTPTPPPSPIGTLAKDVTTTAHNVTEESAATHNAPHTGTHNALHAGEGEDVLADIVTMRENLSGNKLHTSWLDRDRIYVCIDRKSTRLNSSHTVISYAVFCLKKKTKNTKLYNK